MSDHKRISMFSGVTPMLPEGAVRAVGGDREEKGKGRSIKRQPGIGRSAG